jgi:hypothetical protein
MLTRDHGCVDIEGQEMHITETKKEKYKVPQRPTIKVGTELDPLARQMGDLYKECIRQVISDDEVQFHVVMMPSMTGSHFVFSANVAEEEELSNAVENILGVDVSPDDCIVLLGREMLRTERNEDEMMEIVLADISMHLDRLWPIADPTCGWMGSYIGVATLASIIACSHDVLKMLSPPDALVTRIKDMASNAIRHDKRLRTPKLEIPQNRVAFDAIEMVCDHAFETQGSYLTLPNTARTLRNAAKSVFIETVDGMSQPLRTLI